MHNGKPLLVLVTLRGAGGSAATWIGGLSYIGGSGGFAQSLLTLPESTTMLDVYVGQKAYFPSRTAAWPDGGLGGEDGSNTAGGGGGRSAVRIGMGMDDLLTAGGGGGGGYGTGGQSGNGGNGGGLYGMAATPNNARSGKGGSPGHGGAAGVGSKRTGSPGSKYQGGHASSVGGYGAGGGGGGYFGGGGAGAQGGDHGGGGGGSGFAGPFIDVSYAGTVLTTGGGASPATDGSATISFFYPHICGLLLFSPGATRLRIISANYPEQSLGHSGLSLQLRTNVFTASDTSDLWNVVEGLVDPGAVSFSPVDDTTRFVRHQSQKIYAHQDSSFTSDLHRADATWRVVPALWGADQGYVSFQSYNYPTYYLRHSSQLLINSEIATETHRMDASYMVTQAAVSSP